MMQRTPPLNALRAFEAAARHLSVKAAAAELHVTPGAVSQLLKALELHLGVKLFNRVNRGIFLTEAGQSYLPPIRNAFRQIAEASRRLAVAAETGILTVSVTPFFASAWLVPRLKAFQDAHPEIDLQVVTSNALVDFSRDAVDVAVRHGLGRYPGLASDRVIGPPRGPAFDDSGLLLKAVLAGQGAGLLPAAMVALDVAARRLVKVADVTMLDDFAYYLVCPAEYRERPKITAFRNWILEAAAADEHASRSRATKPRPRRGARPRR